MKVGEVKIKIKQESLQYNSTKKKISKLFK